MVVPAAAQFLNTSKSAPSSFDKTKMPSLSLKRPEKTQPLYLTGDELVYDTRGNKVVARGNVEIYYGSYSLTADEVTYDRNANTLTASGNVTLKDPDGNITRGEKIDVTDDFRDGFIESLSVVTSDESRIAARRAIRRDGNVTEFEDGRYSPCRSDPGKPPLWCISAARVIHDKAAQTLTYQDAQFQLYGNTVLWLPYFQHPDPSVKRRSGFLLPEIGSSTNLGLHTEVPYFFDLAPNYDFTFHPMVTSKQGILWQGDWRHRVAIGDVTGIYSVKLAGIDQSDTPEITNKSLTNKLRGSIESHAEFSLATWWKFGWDVIIESDDTFRRFYGLDDILQTDRVNRAYLTGISDRNYFGAYLYQFGGLLLNQSTPLAESRAAPVIDYNYVVGEPVLGGELKVNTNALNFSRSLNYQNQSVNTEFTRAAFDATWRKQLIDGLGQVFTPFADVKGDVSNFTDAVDPITGQLTSQDGVTRAVASAGVLYSYPWALATAGGTHTIEPIAQIIARQKRVDQRHLPDEDARSIVFDDTNLFDLDKTSGYDRLETGTRANYGVQYTFQSTGGMFARFLVGQSYHLSGDNIYANPGVDSNGTYLYSPTTGLQTDRSDYVTGLYLSPSPLFRAAAQARFDEQTLNLRRADVFGSFNYGPFAANAVYTFTSYDPLLNVVGSQQDVLGMVGVKLTDRWSVIGQMRYDIDARQRIQDIYQVKYTDECFVLSATYTETLVSLPASDLQPDKSIMLRFELKNLGQFSTATKTDKLDQVFGANRVQTP